MKVTVRLFTTLKRYLPPGSDGRSARMDIDEGSTVMDLVESAGIPRDLPHIVMVNSRKASLAQALEDGDTVSLFPAIGGGGSVSVIIPACKDDAALKETLLSLRRQTVAPLEVIVVDDRPGEHPAADAAQHADKVLKTHVKGGPARARNIGVRNASGDIIAFTDADCVVAGDWIERILENFSANDADALMGNTVAPPSTFLGACISSLGFPGGGSLGFESMWPVDEKGYTITLSTCNCALRREAFERFGWFDEDFTTAGGEDTVFAQNLRALGGKIRFCTDMGVDHTPITSMPAFIRWQLTRGIGNYWIRRKLGSVAHFVRLRVWSTRNLIAKRSRDPGLPLILALLFMAFTLQQIGYLWALFRYGGTRGAGRGRGTPEKPVKMKVA